MARPSRLARWIAQCPTALLVLVALAGLALDFYASLAVPLATWWLRAPGTFLGLFLFVLCGSAVYRRHRDHHRSG